jgi:hypothetical protein
VVVTGPAGPALDTFVRRTADTLDVPLVTVAELAAPADVARLAAFDGWVTTGVYDARLAPVLERAEALVHLDLAEPTTLSGLVKRTLKRVRADAAPPAEQAWLAALQVLAPALPVVRLARSDEVEEWLRRLS